MTSEECKTLAEQKFVERKMLVDKYIKANETLDILPLLNWAMNQLFKSARELELLSTIYCENESLTSIGCDVVAESILKKLIKTKKGWNLVYQTNPKLLKGYKKP